MTMRTVLLMLFGAAFALTASLATPARAQATRTWVSGVGDDANPCSRTAPCKTLAGAVSKTAAGGEIDCLDPGGFGALTITKSITIDCGSGETGQVGSVLVAGTNGIVVAAGAGDVVNLRKLSINGIKTSQNIANAGLSGIRFISGGTLLIDNVNIMHFQNFGVDMAVGGAANMAIIDSNITDCGNGSTGGAVHISASGSPSLSVALFRVRMTENDLGVFADGTGASPLRVSITDSLASNNLFAGFLASTTSGATIMMLDHVTASNNGSFGIRGNGANATVQFGSSTISGNVTGIRSDNGATVQSYQNNQINQNGTDGTPVAAVALH